MAFTQQGGVSRRTFVKGSLAASALAALAGCGTTSGGSADGGSAAAGNENYFRYYMSEPAFIDPYNAQENQGTTVVRATFDGLVTWDWNTSSVVPLAAADLPTISEDGLTYTFTLREGMTFHNGDAVDAASFKRGWERIASPSMATPSDIAYHLDPIAGKAEYLAGEADEISGLVVVDELTFQVTLTAPMGDFLAVCCHPALVPVPQAALDDPATFLEQPIGNGPFKLDEPWQHNQYIIMSRFDGYYGEPATVDGVYMPIYADPDTAYRALQADELDFAMIPAGQIQDAIDTYGLSEDGYTVTPGAQALTGAEASVYYLVLNLEDEVLSNPDVRHAISLAINRQNIADAVFDGTRAPATSIFPPIIDDDEASTWEYCQYDPERAQQILADAGIDPSTISIELGYNGDGGHEELMSAVQSDLEAIGITVTQNTMEWAAYLEALSDGDFQIARLGWIADYPTMDNFLYPNFFSTADNNYSRYNNPEVDAAMVAARQITDDEERRATYREINAQIAEDLPVIPVLFYSHNYAGGSRIQNFFYDPQSIGHFAEAQLA